MDFHATLESTFDQRPRTFLGRLRELTPQSMRTSSRNLAYPGRASRMKNFKAKAKEKSTGRLTPSKCGMGGVSSVTILEGGEVRIGFYDRVGSDQPRGHPEGAEGPEGCPRG